MDPSSVASQAMAGTGVSEQAAREVSVMLSANTGPYQEEMKQASAVTDKVTESLHKLEKTYAATLRSAGKAMTGIGAAMTASIGGAVWSAADFEESFARVAKTTGLENTLGGKKGRGADFAASLGIGSNELQEFQNDIRGLSTEIPVSVQELSYLADIAGTLGVESKNLTLFADTAAKLGAAIAGLGSDQAIAGLANLIGAFGRAEGEVVNLGSSLADLANHTRGNASEILQFSDRLAGTAVQVGMTAEEVMGLGAAVSAIGAEPQLGASAIVQAMNTISVAIQDGGSDLDGFARAMGMTTEELESLWADGGPTATFTRLLSSLNQQGEEAVTTLRSIGLSGVGTTQILGGLAAQLGVYNEAMEISISASEKGSAVAELAAVRFDTVHKAMQRFGQTTAEVFRSVGVGFLAPLKVLIDAATGLVNVFNMIPQPIKTMLGLLVGLGGVVMTVSGAFTMFFATFHAFFALLYAGPQLLKLLSTGLEKLGPGTEAAIRQIDKLAAHLQRVGNFFQAIPEKIGAFFRSIRQEGALATLSKGFDAARAKAQAFWSAAISPRVGNAKVAIGELFEDVWPRMTAGMGAVGRKISKFSSDTIEKLRAAFASLPGGFDSLRKKLGSTFNDALLQIGIFASQSRKILGEVAQSAGERFAQLREGIASIFRGATTTQDGSANIFGRLIAGAKNGMADLYRVMRDSSREATRTIIEALREGLPGVISLLSDAASRMRTALVEAFKNLPTAITTAFSDFVTYASVIGQEFIDKIRNAFGSGLPSIVDWIKRKSGDITAGFALGFEELQRRTRLAMTRVAATMSDFIRDTLPRMASSFRDLGTRSVEALRSAFDTVAPRLASWATTTASQLSSAFVAGFSALRARSSKAMADVASGMIEAYRQYAPGIYSTLNTVFSKVVSVATFGSRSLLKSIKPSLQLAGEIFATFITNGITALQGFTPAIKRVARELGSTLLTALQYVGRAVKWVMKEFVVKETLETMAFSIRAMAWSAKQAVKPILAYGRSVRESFSQAVLQKVTAFREAFSSLGKGEGAGVLAKVLAHTSVQVDALRRNVAVAMTPIASAFAGVASSAKTVGQQIKAAFGPRATAMITAFQGRVAIAGLSIKAMLGPIGMIIAAFTALGAGFYALDKWKSRNQDIAKSFFEVAEAAGLASEEIERMSWATTSGGDKTNIAVIASDTVNQLRQMSKEGADSLSFSYAASLVRGGQDPERVADHVNELRRLAGLSPIEFNYTFRELSSDEGYENWLSSSRQAAQGLFSDQLGAERVSDPIEMIGTVFGRTPERFENAFQDMIQQIKDIGDSNLPALVTMVHDLEDSIDEAVDTGQITQDMGENIRDDLYANVEDSLPGRVESSSSVRGYWRLVDVVTLGLINDSSPSGQRSRRALTGYGGAQDWYAEIVGNEENLDNENLDPIFEAVRNITGEVTNLDDAVRNLDADGMARLRDETERLAVELQNARMVDTVVDIEGRFGRTLFEQQNELNPDNYSRFAQDFIQSYPREVGHDRALREMYMELERVIDGTSRWSEETKGLSDAIRSVEEQYAQIQMQEIQLELRDMSAIERLDRLWSEITALTDEPHNIVFRMETQNAFRDAYHGQVDNFRSTMQQYENMLEKREDVIENHNLRLEKMQENHDRNLRKMEENRLKSIERLNEQYQERLEDIAEAESDALEDRVEAVSDSISIIQRLQSKPSADFGSMLENMQAQNRAIREATENIEQLQSMGLDQDIIEHLGLADPNSISQSRRMIEMALSDPGIIDRINAEWAKRLDLTEAMVDTGGDRDNIIERFDEQRERAKEALDKQLEDIEERFQESLEETNENYARSVDDANEAHQRQLEQIGENLAKLGEDTFKTVDELIEAARASSLENLVAMADEIESQRARLSVLDFSPYGAPADAANAALEAVSEIDNVIDEYDSNAYGLGVEEAADIGVGMRDGLEYTWRDLQADMARGATSAFGPLANAASVAVSDAETELRGIHGVWDTANEVSRDGATGLTETIAMSLEEGADEIDRVLEERLGSSITDNLELPALIAAHERRVAIEETNARRSPQDDRPATPGTAFANGGFLPDEAVIKSAGTLVQWAEPETGGEAFIPLAASKRGRSREIWMETGRLLGMDEVLNYARGGILGSSFSGPRGRERSGGTDTTLVNAITKALSNASLGSSETNHWDVTVKANDARTLVRELESKKRLSRLAGGKNE